jgi:5-methyltetrahydropteroyltriglutamate--homocysteine methyltransferase
LDPNPQCGFASVVEGNKVTEADQRAKLELLVDIARRTWGKS